MNDITDLLQTVSMTLRLNKTDLHRCRTRTFSWTSY